MVVNVYSPEPLELFLIRVKLNIVGVSRMHEADEVGKASGKAGKKLRKIVCVVVESYLPEEDMIKGAEEVGTVMKKYELVEKKKVKCVK